MARKKTRTVRAVKDPAGTYKIAAGRKEKMVIRAMEGWEEGDVRAAGQRKCQLAVW